MVMKKLIAISVVFALVAGAAFAVDLGGEVIGTVNLIQGDNSKKGKDVPKVSSGAAMDRLRLQGEGANEEGTFGGWIRAEAGGSIELNDDDEYEFLAGGFAGHAWWKPIDQFKIWIGSNGGDGFFSKEGNTGWMFYQRASDTGIVSPGNVWGGGYSFWPCITRSAFYGGGIDGGNALYMTIGPFVDTVSVNLEIPFFDHDGNTKEIFKGLVGQVDLNFNFGNIALTYAGSNAGSGSGTGENGKIFAYFGGEFGKLALDAGVGFAIPGEVFEPIAVGLGVKVDITDAFGLKARVVTNFLGDDENFNLLADVLPYFGITDNLKLYASLGLAMLTNPNKDGVGIGWHVNPYAWIGQEWGPSFWAGLKIWGDKAAGADKGSVNWAVPIAIGVSF